MTVAQSVAQVNDPPRFTSGLGVTTNHTSLPSHSYVFSKPLNELRQATPFD